MSEDVRQWVVRGVEDELARQFVDRAARQRRTTGEVLNEVLRDYLARPEGQGGAPSGPGDVGDFAAQLAALAERVERLEASQVPSAIPDLPFGDGGKGRVPPAISGGQGSAPDVVEPGGDVEVPETIETHPGASGAVSEMDVTGGDDGTRRRLTPAGDAKVDTLLRAGIGIAEIAGMFAVDQNTIRQRRKKLEAKYGPGLGILPLELARQVDEMLKAGRPPVEIQAILPPPQGDRRGCLMPAKTEADPAPSGRTVESKQTRQKWTDADDDVLRRTAAEGGTQADAARELGRPSSVVNGKWKVLGLPVLPRKGRKLKR